ncbi:Rhomboid family protein [Minicystis rosea]|nr:Rhomboid family protein [Minicystis rosea]
MKLRGKVLGGSIALLWIIHLVNVLVGYRLSALGIHPRTLEGLWGVLFAPFLHVGFAHLIANSISLALIGSLVLMRRVRDFLTVAALSALTAGLGTWLIGGAHTVHIGASGVIFGLLGYLFSRGVFERKFWPILGSVIAFLLFGRALTGLIPGTSGISWEGHLFGFLGGILAARLGAQPSPPATTAPSGTKTRIAPVRARIEEPSADPALEDEVQELRRRMSR